MKIKVSTLKKIIREETQRQVSADDAWKEFWKLGPRGQFANADELAQRNASLFVADLRKLLKYADAVVEKEEWYTGPNYGGFFRVKSLVRTKWLGRAGILSATGPRTYGAEFSKQFDAWGSPGWGISKGPDLWEATRFFHEWLGE
jgi:hypothetical protein